MGCYFLRGEVKEVKMSRIYYGDSQEVFQKLYRGGGAEGKKQEGRCLPGKIFLGEKKQQQQRGRGSQGHGQEKGEIRGSKKSRRVWKKERKKKLRRFENSELS